MTELIQAVVDGVATGSIYALIAMGFSFLFATTKVFNAAYGANLIVAAFTYIAIGRWIPGVVGIAIAIVLAVVIGSVFSVASTVLVFDRMRSRSRGFYATFLASFGLAVLVQNVVAIFFGTDSQQLGSQLLVGVNIGSILLSRYAMIAVGSTIAVSVSLAYYFFRTPQGLQLRAMADNGELTEALGFNVAKLRLIAFGLAGAILAPGGILLAYSQGISPVGGLSMLTVAMAATIVGGVGSISGAGISALALGLAESLTVLFAPSTWATPLAFALFFIVLMVKPRGFANRGWA